MNCCFLSVRSIFLNFHIAVSHADRGLLTELTDIVHSEFNTTIKTLKYTVKYNDISGTEKYNTCWYASKG